MVAVRFIQGFSSNIYTARAWSVFGDRGKYLQSVHTFFCLFVCLFYLFLAVLGLHCYAWSFSSCGERGLLFVAVHGLLIAVASLVVEHGL